VGNFGEHTWGISTSVITLGVQEEAKRLAVDVRQRDGVDLQPRVGLNSGQLIAGEIGSSGSEVPTSPVFPV
jgi:class 3 adenylate cyclase